MECPTCNASLVDGSKFCERCGTALSRPCVACSNGNSAKAAERAARSLERYFEPGLHRLRGEFLLRLGNSDAEASLLRALELNHTYHHRGQLSVYLRLLDVPVPSIYGPSADENPFAART